MSAKCATPSCALPLAKFVGILRVKFWKGDPEGDPASLFGLNSPSYRRRPSVSAGELQGESVQDWIPIATATSDDDDWKFYILIS
jgi:hypothetical protein